ncbi:MAG TPA: peptidase M1 [Sphingobacteriaceae bacterium]|nr:peptidase M1 [Sphingobacteriaceae bacterium]
MVRKLYSLLFMLAVSGLCEAQTGGNRSFSRADSLRGNLTPLRTCYDINYYHLDVKVNIDEKFISGSNLFVFTAVNDFKHLQFDLFANLNIQRVLYKGKELKFTREFNAVFVDFPKIIRKGNRDEFQVFYSGNPTIARRAPWDGGFVFAKDQSGKPWVAVACQGFGASSWWPTKDHQADEVDSMEISISVPPGLMDVSNGRLRSTKKMQDGYTQYNWAVSYPINNYTVTVNIADYAHFMDSYAGKNGKLSLDYYVLRENLEKAKVQFGADVKPMFDCFENWFGPYPFYRDGYKLVETPYLGMEHQSAVAYGNKYMKGYLGRDLSGTGLGLKWDYIIIHETAHEWWGNSITAKDVADMWIHEGFASYAEGVFVEFKEGKEAGANYIKGLRRTIRNDRPIIGPYNVNQEGSGDMYSKGANLLHTVRTVINDDAKWQEILRGLNKDLGLKTTTTEEVVQYINTKSGKDLTKIFDQYLRYKDLPVLELKRSGNSISYRWNADVADFDMPVRIKISDKDWMFIRPAKEWKSISLENTAALVVDTDNFYIIVKNL